jgi:hypothetical protein
MSQFRHYWEYTPIQCQTMDVARDAQRRLLRAYKEHCAKTGGLGRSPFGLKDIDAWVFSPGDPTDGNTYVFVYFGDYTREDEQWVLSTMQRLLNSSNPEMVVTEKIVLSNRVM